MIHSSYKYRSTPFIITFTLHIGASTSTKYLYSPLVKLHNNQTPLHQRIKLEIKAKNIPLKYRNKALLATFDTDYKTIPVLGDWKKWICKSKYTLHLVITMLR